MIGITGIGGLGEFAVVESLKRNGLTKDHDYTLLNIEGGTAARMAALRAGKVQAVPLTPGQRVQAEKEGLSVILDTRRSAGRVSFHGGGIDPGIHGCPSGPGRGLSTSALKSDGLHSEEQRQSN